MATDLSLRRALGRSASPAGPRVVCLVIGLGLLAAAAPEASARAGARKTLVLLAARNRPALAKRAVQAVRSQLSDTKVVLRVVWINRLAAKQVDQVALSRRHAAKAGVLAVAWYDANQPDKVLLYAAGTGRLVVRRVSGPTVGGRLEALAIIVRSSMLALLAGQPLPVGPRIRPRARPRPRARVIPGPRRRRGVVVGRRPPRPKPRPVGPRRHRRGWRFGLALEAGYRLIGHSTDVGVLHGAVATAVVRLRRGWAVSLGYRVVQRIVAEAGTVRLAVQPHPISLGARWRRQWGRFGLGVAASLELDYATLHTTSSDPLLDTSRDQGDLHWSATAAVRSTVRLVRRLGLFLEGGARIGLSGGRYQVNDGTTMQTIVAPWPVLPCVILGLSVDLL